MKHFAQPAWIFMLLMTFSQTACRFYQTAPISIHRVQELDVKKVQCFLVNDEQPLTDVWRLKRTSFKKRTVTCTAIKLPIEEAKNVVFVDSKNDARASQDNVYLFAKSELVAKLKRGDSLLVFDYQMLDRMQVVEPNFNKSINNSIVLVIGLSIRILPLIFSVL